MFVLTPLSQSLPVKYPSLDPGPKTEVRFRSDCELRGVQLKGQVLQWMLDPAMQSQPVMVRNKLAQILAAFVKVALFKV